MRVGKLLTGITSLGLLLGSSSAFAAVPMSFTHHGILYEDGQPASGTKAITATIYNGAGDIIAQITKPVVLENGFYNFTIENIDEAKVIAAEGSMELGIQVDTADEMTPRIAISSVPFAIQASFADVADALQCNDCIDENHLSDGAVNVNKLSSDLQSKLNSFATNESVSGIKYALSDSAGGSALKAVADGEGKNIASTYAKQNGNYSGMTVGNATSAASATKATQDSDGNVIKDTYAKQNGNYSSLSVGYATSAGSASSADQATKDSAGNTISSTYAKTSGTYGNLYAGRATNDGSGNNIANTYVKKTNIKCEAYKQGAIVPIYEAVVKINCGASDQVYCNTPNWCTCRGLSFEIANEVPGGSMSAGNVKFETQSVTGGAKGGIIDLSIKESVLGTPLNVRAESWWPLHQGYSVPAGTADGYTKYTISFYAMGQSDPTTALNPLHFPSPLVTSSTTYSNQMAPGKPGAFFSVIVYGIPAGCQ